MEKLNLGWGDPYFLLEILNKMYRPSFGSTLAIQNCTYAPDIGEDLLVNQVKEITKHLTGESYKHILITNGATQALNTIMRSWEDRYDIQRVFTSQLGYPYYPMMVRKSHLSHCKVDLATYKRTSQDRGISDMLIVDSPPNPLGEQFFSNNDTIMGDKGIYIAWDAVYHNPIYNACPAIKPRHDVFVGSFSKLLGLTGARVGWIATNSDSDFRDFTPEALYENATVSKPSQKLIMDILSEVDLQTFMKFGKNSLDQNRQILHKISGLLGSDVQEKGMFYCAEVDNKMFDLFYKANIHFIQFELEGKKFIRLNIGQTSDILTKAVKAINKIDGR